MRTVRLLVLLLAVVLAAVVLTPAGVATGQARTTWYAPLSGDEEVPRNASRGAGFASFELAPAGNALQYYLFVDNIQNVQMAHIHIGAAGQNGPIAVWLYPPAPPARLISGTVSGMIGQGTITTANFTGPLQGQPFGALVNAFNNGTAYVNVHTTQFPGGEIRGQIR
jgi:ribosomal protein L35AE/L33A